MIILLHDMKLFLLYCVILFFSCVKITLAARELDQFVTEESILSIQNNEKKTLDLHHVNRNVRRYMKTFLHYSKLTNPDLLYEVPDDEFYYTKITFRLTGKQLRLLQKVYHEDDHMPSLEDLDNIFSTIMYRSSVDEAISIFSWLQSLSGLLWHSMDTNIEQKVYFVVMVVFLWKACTTSLNRKLIIQACSVLLIVEGISQYFRNLREANIKSYLQMKRLKGIPKECDPTNLGALETAWISFQNIFREDPCLSYHKLTNSHFADDVSIVQSLLQPFFSFIEMISKNFGYNINHISSGIAGSGIFGSIAKITILPFVLLVVTTALLFVALPVNFKFSSWLLGSIQIDRSNKTSTEPVNSSRSLTDEVESALLRVLSRLSGKIPAKAIKVETKASDKLEIDDTDDVFEDCIENLEDIVTNEEAVTDESTTSLQYIVREVMPY